MHVKSIVVAALFSLFSFKVHSAEDNLNTFLTSSAYGAGAGALVGVASIAFDSDPSGKIGNIARGASLGLYCGIAWGLYQIYRPAKVKNDYIYGSVFVLPEFDKGHLAGLNLYSKIFEF